jgi:hypothetical protein
MLVFNRKNKNLTQRNTFHVQTAYLFENIAGALQLYFMVSMLAFVKYCILITLFAGYTENEYSCYYLCRPTSCQLCGC